MEPDRRTRALGAFLTRAVGPVERHTPEKRARLRRRDAPRFVRELLEGAPAAGVRADDLVVPGADQDVPVRLYLPPGGPAPAARPIIVVFPGGGWVYGGVGASAWLCSQLAARVDAVVAEVGYRLAPEHPAPAAHVDAYAATSWLAEHAEQIGGRADRLAVLGDSAGGNVAATVALAARDRGGPAIAFQALIYPATDLTLASSSVTERPNAPILTSSDLRSYVDMYLGGAADPRDPLVSPLLADNHAGLPPALVINAEHDPLRDDGRRYADALRSAEVSVQHVEIPGSAHGFFSFARVCRSAADPALAILVASLHGALRPAGDAADRGLTPSPIARSGMA